MRRDGVVLVDTSSWIETLRPHGDPVVRQRVSDLLLEGQAAWCNIVRLELWHGVRGAGERDALKSLESVVAGLEINDHVWEQAIDLGRLARSRGLTVQSADLLIVATAKYHGAQIDSCDAHVARLSGMN